MAYEYEWMVRTGDTDFSGLIYTPRVIDCAMRGMEDLNTSLGFSAARVQEASFYLPVVNVTMNYTGSIHVSDVVDVRCIPDLGDSSVTFDFTGLVDGKSVFNGSITVVFMDKEGGEAIPIPDEYSQRVKKYIR